MLTLYLSAMAKSKYWKWGTGAACWDRQSVASCETLFPIHFVLNVNIENCIPVHSPRCSGVLRLRTCLMSRCMALGLRGALEGLTARNRPMSEEGQAFTSLTAWHWGVVCMIVSSAHCASETWTAQVWLLEWAKDIPPGKCFTERASSCVTGGQEAGGYCLETLLTWVVVLPG